MLRKKNGNSSISLTSLRMTTPVVFKGMMSLVEEVMRERCRRGM